MKIETTEYEFLADKNILILKPSLIYRSQELLEVYKEIKNLVIKHGYPNVLADFRSLEIEFSLRSIIEKVKQWKLLRVRKDIKIALLFSKLDEEKIILVNILFSHGFKVLPYTYYNQAIEWLAGI